MLVPQWLFKHYFNILNILNIIPALYPCIILHPMDQCPQQCLGSREHIALFSIGYSNSLHIQWIHLQKSHSFYISNMCRQESLLIVVAQGSSWWSLHPNVCLNSYQGRMRWWHIEHWLLMLLPGSDTWHVYLHFSGQWASYSHTYLQRG